MLLLVGAFTVGVLLFASSAEAHGAHSAPIDAVAADVEADHDAHGHLSHCHGGAFCPAAAVVSLSAAVPAPTPRCGRCAWPDAAAANAAPGAFDPPPPRVLI